MRYDGVAPVADHELAEPARVLKRHWLIEAELVLESTNVGVGHVRIVLVSGEGAAGYRLQDRERCDADPEQERDRLDQPPQDVRSH